MQIKAYAKINLALDILDDPSAHGRKTSELNFSGYHRIQTVLQQIDLCDIITIKKTIGPKIILTCSDKSVPLDQKNTIQKVISELKKITKKLPSGLQIHLQKNIPVSAGLGGGSSDAAAILKALNTIWKLKLTDKKITGIATKIGMDTPFFLQGGTALATHFGEKIQNLRTKSVLLPQAKRAPLPSLPRASRQAYIPMLLFVPGTKKSTKIAYREIDALRTGQEKAKTKTLCNFLKNARSTKNLKQFFPLIHNDFDLLYGKKFASLKKKLYQLKAATIHHSGSGPALYAIFENRHDQNQAYLKLKKYGAKKITTKN